MADSRYTIEAILRARNESTGVFEDFKSDVDEAIRRAELLGATDPTVDVTLDDHGSGEQLASLDESTARLDGSSANIDVRVDPHESREILSDIHGFTGRLDESDPTVDVRVDVGDTVTSLDSVLDKTRQVDGSDATVTIDANDNATPLMRKTEEVRAALDARRATINLDLMGEDNALISMERVERHINRLDGQRVTAFADVRTSEAEGKLDRLGDDLLRLDEFFAEATAEVDTYLGHESLVSIQGQLEGFDKRIASARATVQTVEGMRRLRDIGAELSDFQGRVGTARVDIETRWAEERLNWLERALVAFGLKKVDARVGVDGVPGSLAQLAIMERAVDRVDRKSKIEFIMDWDDKLADNFGSLTGDLGAALTKFETPAAILQANIIPGLLLGIGAIPAVAGLAAGAVGGLGFAVSEGLVGALGLGIGAIGLFTTSLGAWGYFAGAAASQSLRGVSAVAKARDAVNRAIPGTETYANAQDNLREATAALNKEMEQMPPRQRRFTQSILDFQSAWGELREEIGDRTLPTLTRFVNYGTEQIPLMRQPLLNMTGDIDQVSESFIRSMESGRQMSIMEDIYEGIGQAGGNAFELITSGLRLTLNVGAPLIPYSNELIGRYSELTTKAAEWSSTAEGQQRIGEVWAGLMFRAGQLADVAGNLGVTIGNVYDVFDDTGYIDKFAGGMVDVTDSLREATEEGGRAERFMTNFLEDTEPALDAVWRLAGDLASEFFRVGEAIGTMKMPNSDMLIMTDILDDLGVAAGYVGDALITNFERMGPVVGDLIVEMAEFFSIFGPADPLLVDFLEVLTWVLKRFNDLPDPMQRVIGRTIALGAVAGSVLGSSGGGGVLGLVGGLVQMRTNMTLLSSTTGRHVSRLEALTGVYRDTNGTVRRLDGSVSGLNRTFGSNRDSARRAATATGNVGRASLIAGDNARTASRRFSGFNQGLLTTGRRADGMIVPLQTSGTRIANVGTKADDARPRLRRYYGAMDNVTRASGDAIVPIGNSGTAIATSGEKAQTANRSVRRLGNAYGLLGGSARQGKRGLDDAGSTMVMSGDRADDLNKKARGAGSGMMYMGGGGATGAKGVGTAGTAARTAGTRASLAGRAASRAGNFFSGMGAKAALAGGSLVAFAGGPVGIAIIAVAGLALGLKLLYDRNENFRGGVNRLGKNLRENEDVMEFWNGIVGDLKDGFKKSGEQLGNFASSVNDLFEAFGEGGDKHEKANDRIRGTGSAAKNSKRPVDEMSDAIGNVAGAYNSINRPFMRWQKSYSEWLENQGSVKGYIQRVVVPGIVNLGEWLNKNERRFNNWRQGVSESIGRAKDDAMRVFRSWEDRVNEWGANMWQSITRPFRRAYNAIVGNSIVPDLRRDVLRSINSIPNGIKLGGLRGKIGGAFEDAFQSSRKWLRNLRDSADNETRGAGNDVSRNLGRGSKQGSDRLRDLWTGGRRWLSNLGDDAGKQTANARDRIERNTGQAERGSTRNHRRLVGNAMERLTELKNERQTLDYKAKLDGHFSEAERISSRKHRQLEIQAKNRLEGLVSQNSTARHRDKIGRETGEAETRSTRNHTNLKERGTDRLRNLDSEGTGILSRFRDMVGDRTNEAENRSTSNTTNLRDRGASRIADFKNWATDRLSEFRDNTGDRTNEAENRSTSNTTNLRDRGASRIKDFKNWATDRLNEFRDNTGDRTDEAENRSTNNTTNLRDRGASRIRDFKNWATDRLNEFRDNTGDRTDEAENRSTRNTQNLRERGTEAIRNFRDAGGKATAELADRVGSNTSDANSRGQKWMGALVGAAGKILGFFGADKLADDAAGLASSMSRAKRGGILDSSTGESSGGIETFQSGGLRSPQAFQRGGMRPHRWEDRLAGFPFIGQTPTGGIADGNMPRAIYGEGEGGKEAYIRERRPKDEQLPYLQEAAAWHNSKVVPDDSLGREVPPSTDKYGNFIPGYSPNPVTADVADAPNFSKWHRNVYDYIAERANKVKGAVGGINWNTYQDHITSPGANEWSSVDFWAGDPGATIGRSQGDAVVQYVQNNLMKGMLGMAWWHRILYGGQWRPFKNPHTNHVHVGWSADKNAGIVQGTGGGGGSSFDVLGYITDKLGDLVKVPEIGAGVIGEGFLESGKTIVEAAKDFLMEKGQELMGSLGGLTSGTAGTIGEALKKGGWPEDKMVEASSVVWSESTGNAQAQNPSGARGLMQIMPGTAAGVGSDYAQLFDPVYNTSTGLKVYRQAGGWGPWVGSHTRGDFRNKPVTNAPPIKSRGDITEAAQKRAYADGGIAMSPQWTTLAEDGPEIVMPLSDPQTARRFMQLLRDAAPKGYDSSELRDDLTELRNELRGAGGRGEGSGSSGGSQEAVRREIRRQTDEMVAAFERNMEKKLNASIDNLAELAHEIKNATYDSQADEHGQKIQKRNRGRDMQRELERLG